MVHAAGIEMRDEDWRTDGHTIGVFFGDRPFFAVLFNAARDGCCVHAAGQRSRPWHLLLDTALDERGCRRGQRRGDRGVHRFWRARSPCSTGHRHDAARTRRRPLYRRAGLGAHRAGRHARGVHRGANGAGEQEHRAADPRAARRRSADDRRHARRRALGRGRACGRSATTAERSKPERCRCATRRWCASSSAARRRSKRAACRFRSALRSSAYRVTLDVRTYGHAGIDIVVAPQRAYLPPGEIADVGPRGAALHAALAAATGASATSATSNGSAGSPVPPARRWSGSTRCTPRTAAIPRPPAPTRRRRAASSTGWPSTSTRCPKPCDPDVQHYIASVSDDLAALRANRSSTTPASRWSRPRR